MPAIPPIRHRFEAANRQQEIIAFLICKWSIKLDYRLIKELWALDSNRIAVRFAIRVAMMKRVSSDSGIPAQFSCPSRNPIANFTGRLENVRTDMLA
jgi:Protein of unknown function (DUF1348)